MFRTGTDRFVAAPGSLARTIAGSIGDKLRPRARIVLRRLLAVNKRRPSDIDPAKRALLRPGQNGGRVSILKCLRPIWTDKPETARRVQQRIERILSAADV
ncbi:MAG: phage integrase central domain-containing protein, partial [Hyphomonas sp.]